MARRVLDRDYRRIYPLKGSIENEHFIESLHLEHPSASSPGYLIRDAIPYRLCGEQSKRAVHRIEETKGNVQACPSTVTA
jgi:hypothetical protein